MRSFGETPGKREALLNKLVKISETPVKREETPGKGEEPMEAVLKFHKAHPRSGREASPPVHGEVQGYFSVRSGAGNFCRGS